MSYPFFWWKLERRPRLGHVITNKCWFVCVFAAAVFLAILRHCRAGFDRALLTGPRVSYCRSLQIARILQTCWRSYRLNNFNMRAPVWCMPCIFYIMRYANKWPLKCDLLPWRPIITRHWSQQSILNQHKVHHEFLPQPNLTKFQILD